ncbi:MAG: SCO family protein, partial [Gammaproteobacteria bacterium]|nr:SCO family protein [Gammaproteobacteria bacterium]
MTRVNVHKKTVLGVIALILLLGGWGAWHAVTWFAQREPEPMDTTGLRGVILMTPALALPAFQLVDGDNAKFTNDRLKNHWTLLYFGYTHCPDICPTTMQTLA